MDSYDVIVVGAGAAGSPVAARLSQDPTLRVLLVEAGPDCMRTEDFPADVLNAGLLTGALPGHENNWAFKGNLTPELPYLIARGKGLGGSTTINGTYFIRARKLDFDRWVAQGNDEWTFEKVLPYYKRLETDRTYGESEVHGGSGPMPVFRETSTPHRVTLAFYAACKELGFIEEPDKNADGDPGVGPLPMNAVDGVRINTGIAYINPHRGRANLDVLGNTLARKVIFDGTQAVGLEVESRRGVETIELSPGGEVVLSAGAIKTPHLLALSGIGPRAELDAAGIAVITDLPGVGKAFSDHPDILVTWRPRRRLDVDKQRDLFQVVLNFTATGSEHVGDLEIMPQLKPLSAAMGLSGRAGIPGMVRILRRPILALKSIKGISLRRFTEQIAHRNDLFFALAVQQADSRGNMTTVSADPHDQPKIDYNYLSAESDLRRMREVIRTSVAILRTKAFAPYFRNLAELDDATLKDDVKLDQWALSHLATSIHACGSAKMGPAPEDGAAVDQYGRVYGVSGVRVADTSILPTVPSRGPACTAVMVGERIADFIKAQHPAARVVADHE